MSKRPYQADNAGVLGEASQSSVNARPDNQPAIKRPRSGVGGKAPGKTILAHVCEARPCPRLYSLDLIQILRLRD